MQRSQDFTRTQPARMCAKDLYALLVEIREAARENQPSPQDCAVVEVK